MRNIIFAILAILVLAALATAMFLEIPLPQHDPIALSATPTIDIPLGNVETTPEVTEESTPDPTATETPTSTVVRIYDPCPVRNEQGWPLVSGNRNENSRTCNYAEPTVAAQSADDDPIPTREVGFNMPSPTQSWSIPSSATPTGSGWSIPASATPTQGWSFPSNDG